eukprot:s822_g21.t1
MYIIHLNLVLCCSFAQTVLCTEEAFEIWCFLSGHQTLHKRSAPDRIFWPSLLQKRGGFSGLQKPPNLCGEKPCYRCHEASGSEWQSRPDPLQLQEKQGQRLTSSAILATTLQLLSGKL